PRRGPPRLGGDRAGARVCQRARRAAGRAAQRPERADRGAGGTEGRGGAGSADRTSHRAACSRRGKRGKRLSERCNREGDRRDGGAVMSADAYGAGEADTLLGRAIEGVDRNSFCLIGAIGHDFYEGEREGAKGFPRFTDPRLRSESKYGDYIRMAAERSL